MQHMRFLHTLAICPYYVGVWVAISVYANIHDFTNTDFFVNGGIFPTNRYRNEMLCLSFQRESQPLEHFHSDGVSILLEHT